MSVQLPAGVTVFERGWLSSNNILCVGENNCALIDTGYASHAAQTEALVVRALGNRPLDVLANTHLHSDHCGGNAALQLRYASMRTLIPPGQAKSVSQWDFDALTYGPTGQSCPRFRFDALLEAGSTVQLGSATWEIHAAPGHDTHAVLLFEPDTRTLISADALWENGFGIVFPELEGEPGFGEVGETLDLIEGLNPLTVIPGHGRVFADIGGALNTARSRLERLRNDPVRHANHAAKVLVKFKLLEVQRLATDELVTWAQETPYFVNIHARFFGAQGLDAWIDGLIEGLIESKAALRDGPSIVNAG
jgi:glyoxylase-like metal-dependent hydrolase (beta-lactamase superfamily II)